MLDRFMDVFAVGMAAVGVAYALWEIKRRRKRLRDLFNVLNAEDAAITRSLEQFAAAGKLKPYAGAAA